MSRLADYFVIVGYDHDSKRGSGGTGKVLQRLPEKDWDDCPFTTGLELFCQPTGHTLSTQQQQPIFYVAVLTDVDGDRHYCAVFTFHEALAITLPKPDDVDVDGDIEADERDSGMNHHYLTYAPKSLVLVSRQDYFETFRNCLGVIYTVHTENMKVPLETLVGNILGCVQVPPPGGPQVRFSLGAGDRQAIQPPLSSMLPVSQDSVALFFDQMGVNNAIKVLCAALTDHKILFFSNSFSRLTAACRALVALYYPLKYSYVYIPVLPASLLEVLSTPTPFIAGVHASLKDELMDLLDVILVDLDGGDIKIPECVTVPLLSDSVLARTKHCLNMILLPELLSADHAFPHSQRKLSPPFQRDKEIRAVFLRMFAEMLTGYRSSLALIRIHPQPFITFHKAHFLGQRRLMEDEFVVRVLDSMAFSAFVAERGPPYRVCDLFDEVYATIQDQLVAEQLDPSKVTEHIQALAHQLYQNESPSQQPYLSKVPKPTEDAHCRIHQLPFPLLNTTHVQDIIDEGSGKLSVKNPRAHIRPSTLRMVPMGPPVTMAIEGGRVVENSARRLEVLRNCVRFIFDNKISDARIIFPAVLLALKTSEARLALTTELSQHVKSGRAVLEHQQFDLVVRLLKCALLNDSSMDEHGVAYNMLPLVNAFCRKLCTGVMQFAYTCIQEHDVWGSLSFWEQAFYQDVHKEIRQLYLPQYEEHQVPETAGEDHHGPHSPRQTGEQSFFWKRLSSFGAGSKKPATVPLVPRQMGALEIAAEQVRVQPSLSISQLEEVERNEESVVFSQAIHYTNRMVYLRLPLDASHVPRGRSHTEVENSSVITASLAGSDSYDAESGFDEMETTDITSSVTKFVMRFVDKVCAEGGVSPGHIKSLHQMVPGVISIHLETLETVHRESKRLPPIQKPKILAPTLLAGEELMMEGLRVYLLPDGREEGAGGTLGGPSLIPAEGGLFLTSYRVIFKGTPCDPFVCKQGVVRAFPVSSLSKEKKISLQYIPHLDQWLHEGLQLRSTTFQMLKVAFDEEVGSENVEMLRKLLHRVRNPNTVFSTFAFTAGVCEQVTHIHKDKEKHATLRHFAKRTLRRTAQKAGFKPKVAHHKHKHATPVSSLALKTTSPRFSDNDSDRASIASDAVDELSVVDENEVMMQSLSSDPKNIERLLEQPSYQDYQRQGLCSLSNVGLRSRSEPFRLSTVNATYSVCRSYPALLVIPQSVNDESIRKFARSHRHSRFPVITWRHPQTKALLLRASGFHSRSSIGMRRHTSGSASSGGELSSGLEQEKYFKLLVAATPISNRSTYPTQGEESLTSFDSLGMLGLGDMLRIPNVPADSVGAGGGGGGSTGMGLVVSASSHARVDGSMTTHPCRTSVNGVGAYGDRTGVADPRGVQNAVNSGGDFINTSVRGLQKVALYVLGEKNQMKHVKVEAFPKCDFIPVEFTEVREVKNSFKKLMAACCPSKPPSSKEHGFLRAVEDSQWLQQVQVILQLAGVVVDLMDVQGASVMVCLEEGWDSTTQVLSVAQVLLDPYYRTLEGFKTLLEKEWLTFGHPFSRRSCQTAANQTSGFIPVFLQFLDCVHQIQRQFPVSFEFNQYFLQFLAYHYVSSRFHSFMMDSEIERLDAGWLRHDSRSANGSMDKMAEGQGHSAKHGHHPLGVWKSSLWDYVEKQHNTTAVFANFLYCPLVLEPVLRPYSNISSLVVWDYYLSESLAHGPTFDLEFTTFEPPHDVDTAPDLAEGQRVVLSDCYDNVTLQDPDFFRLQLQEMERLEAALGHQPHSGWKSLWERLQNHTTEDRDDSLLRRSANTQLMRCHSRASHKRATLAILVKGKMLGEASRVPSQPHHFERCTFSTPTSCDLCQQLLWGLTKTGMRCVGCGYNCHEKCQPQVRKTCSKLKMVTDTTTTTTAPAVSATRISEDVEESSSAVLPPAPSPALVDFSATNSGEYCTHEGYLSKQGALFKQWKQRWFVLDSMKHQMRYYDAKDDPHCKGVMDLAEVESVTSLKSIHGAPKKAEEQSFIEVRTSRRVYIFMAPDAKSAQEWVDKLQSCLHS